MKKHYLLAAFALLSFATADAQDWLVVEQGSASPDKFKLDEIGRITFDGSTMVVSPASASGREKEFSLGALTRLFFTDDGTTVVGSLPSGRRGIAVTDGGNTLLFGEDVTAATVAVYDTGGSKVMEASLSDGSSADISGLRKGVYIAVAGSETFKFIK